MAKLGDFIAFKAAIELLKETGKESVIEQVYKDAKSELKKPVEEIKKSGKRNLQAIYC